MLMASANATHKACKHKWDNILVKCKKIGNYHQPLEIKKGTYVNTSYWNMILTKRNKENFSRSFIQDMWENFH